MPRKSNWAFVLMLGAFFLGGQADACVQSALATALPGSATQMDGHATWYEDPTDRYGHGIMGRVQDASSLGLALSVDGQCRIYRIAAGDDFVFEDIAPRLVDLDRDRLPEIVAVRSSFTEGAQLAVYGVRGSALVMIAATPPIGTRHRWLAPAAWEDLDGDGNIELAYVDRPHLAKTLRVWRWQDGALQELAALRGVTNHAIGEEVIRVVTRNCDDGAEMVLQSADRRRLVGVKLRNNQLMARDLGPASRAEDAQPC